MRTDLKKFSITSLAHQWILCSEWVPSEWESKQLIKTLRRFDFKTWVLANTSLDSSSKTVHPLLSSHIKFKIFCLELFWTIFACNRCLICAYFSPDSDEITFFNGASNIINRGLDWSKKCLNDGYIYYKHATYIWCFYKLFGLSFRRHPFTAVDPLSKWYLQNFSKSVSKKENKLTSWMAWRWVNSLQIFIFRWTISLGQYLQDRQSHMACWVKGVISPKSRIQTQMQFLFTWNTK